MHSVSTAATRPPQNESHLKMAADEFEARMSEETGTGRLGNEEDLSVIANMRNYLLRLRRLAARQKVRVVAFYLVPGMSHLP